MQEILEEVKKIRVDIFDIDGMLADGNLYFRYQNGMMALIEATPKEYKEHGTFQIPDCNSPSYAQPVVAGGKLYLREQDNLFCYNLKKK